MLNEELRSKKIVTARKIKQETSPDTSVAATGRKRLPIKTPRSKVSTVASVTPTVDLGDDELSAMVGATADDQEYEFVNRLCEEEVLSGTYKFVFYLNLWGIYTFYFRRYDFGPIIQGGIARLPKSSQIWE